MKIRLSTYLVYLMGIAGLWIIIVDPAVGLAYTVACGATCLPLFALPIPQRFRYAVLLTAGVVWATHLLRVTMLAPLPALYTYPRVGALARSDLISAIYGIGFHSCALLAGMAIGLASIRLGRRDTRRRANRLPLVLSGRPIVFIALFATVAFEAYLLFVLRVGWKYSDPDPDSSFLVRLIPNALVYGICALYLVEYRYRLSRGAQLYIGFVYLALLLMALVSGSRGFLIRAAFPAVIYVLIRKGDYAISLRRSLLIPLIGAGILLISFAVVAPLRVQLRKDGQVSNVPEVVYEAIGAALDRENIMMWANLVTERLAGVDGYIATQLSRPPLLKKSFAPSATAVRVVSNLVPRMTIGDNTSSGKTIGMVYSGHAFDVKHAGAVGLFGALVLTFGSPSSLMGAFFVGVFWASLLKYSDRLVDSGSNLLLQYILMLAIAEWIPSGNFDLLIPRLVINLVQLMAFTALTGFVVSTVTVRRRFLRGYSIGSGLEPQPRRQ